MFGTLSFLSPSTLPVPSFAAFASGGAPPQSNVLAGFSVGHQQQDEWCWAAVSEGVSWFLGGAVHWTQCEIATAELGLACCVVPLTNGCNTWWYLDRALARVGHFVPPLQGPMNFASVQGQIAGGRPLGCRIQWAGGTAGHFVAIGGWSIDSAGTEYLYVEDPWYGPTPVARVQFEQIGYRNPGDRWTHSYITN